MKSFINLSISLIASGLLFSVPIAAQAKGGGGGHGGGAHAASSANSGSAAHSESNVGGSATAYFAVKAAIAAQKAREQSEHRGRHGGGHGGRGYPYPYDDQNTTGQQFTNSLDTYNQSQDTQRAALPTAAFVHEYHWPKTYNSFQTAQSAPVNRETADVPNRADLAVNVLGNPVAP